jgi:hypothetical protein
MAPKKRHSSTAGSRAAKRGPGQSHGQHAEAKMAASANASASAVAEEPSDPLLANLNGYDPTCRPAAPPIF